MERWQLLLPHRGRLLRLAQRRLVDQSEAEDCVHETLMRAATFPHLDVQRAPEFLTSVLVRLCIDHQRRARRARLLQHYGEMGDSTRHLEDVMCERATGRSLLQVLDELRGREREILLARVRGLSTANAASALGISLKAAEGAFTRGRARLRARFADAL